MSIKQGFTVIKESKSGLCSSRAWWPLAPNFCPWATRKSYFFQNKSYAVHPGFHKFRALGSLQFFLEHSLAEYYFHLDSFLKITRIMGHVFRENDILGLLRFELKFLLCFVRMQNHQPTIGQKTGDCWPTVNWQSANSWLASSKGTCASLFPTVNLLTLFNYLFTSISVLIGKLECWEHNRR